MNSEGFMTIVQPTASAGATFQALEALSSIIGGDREAYASDDSPHHDRIIPRSSSVVVCQKSSKEKRG